MIKRYAPNWRKVYQFAEFGDYDNFFIELCYIVARQDFVSALGSPLINKTGIDGEPIFKSVNIDFTKYKLLNERVEPLEDRNVGLLRVFETYGYAPQKNYQTYSAEPVQQFGLEDPSGFLTLTVNTATPTVYDAVADEFKLQLQSTAGLAVGDLIYAAFTGIGNFNNGSGPQVAIKEVAQTYVVIPAFEMTFYYKNGQLAGNISKQDTANTISGLNPYYWSGTRNFLRDASTRKPRTIITTVFSEVSFYTEFPQLEQKYIVSSGNDETDTITTTTTPNVTAWKQLVADGALIIAQDAAVEAVYPTTFFKKTVKRTRAR